MSAWRRRFEPILTPAWHLWFVLSRRMTLGARALATNERGEVLLVHHTYKKGWELPGGGVERGEFTGEAVARELMEEAGIRSLHPPRLVSVHNNDLIFPGDHVLLYRVDAWEPCPEEKAAGEIEEVRWFAPDALPPDVTPGARRRIGEVLLGAPVDPRW